jgi:type IV pilus assembly protein PilO
MKRSQVVLSVLAAVMIVALFAVLVYQPKQEEIDELETAIAAEQQRHGELEQEIVRLRTVRDQAPEVEAELAAAEAVVPRDNALPTALRQLQLAADDAGLVLTSVTTGRPLPVEGAPASLHRIDVNLQLSGGYFQLVDFLRRVEDPSITPRGTIWTNAALAKEEYPTLTVALSGKMFASIDTPPPAQEAAPAETEDSTDGSVDELEDAPDDEATEEVIS